MIGKVERFQSLIHQVSVSFSRFIGLTYIPVSVSIPYSSGQCFFSFKKSCREKEEVHVSIPYSSGQCFFSYEQILSSVEMWVCFNPLFIRSVFLFRRSSCQAIRSWKSFNPLFIRSVFLLEALFSRMEDGGKCFNPLFIRSVFLLNKPKVILRLGEKQFQSLIHQVSVSFVIADPHQSSNRMDVSIPYSSGQCFFLCQSIFNKKKSRQVSIPYSSGQCFF